MRFVDEFRDAELGRALATEIVSLVEPGTHLKVMEVCGGHTHSIYKYGIDDLLPANVELVHGPGCPVCVIPMGRVDDERGLALCEDDQGRRSSVETALVAPVAPGDVLLVHAGTAIARSADAPDRGGEEPRAIAGGGAVAR